MGIHLLPPWLFPFGNMYRGGRLVARTKTWHCPLPPLPSLSLALRPSLNFSSDQNQEWGLRGEKLQLYNQGLKPTVHVLRQWHFFLKKKNHFGIINILKIFCKIINLIWVKEEVRMKKEIFLQNFNINTIHILQIL